MLTPCDIFYQHVIMIAVGLLFCRMMLILTAKSSDFFLMKGEIIVSSHYKLLPTFVVPVQEVLPVSFLFGLTVISKLSRKLFPGFGLNRVTTQHVTSMKRKGC